jgi:primosomal protein N' (replication factor Y) (superfamily II helicase)
MLDKRFASVCLPVPVDVEFTYAVPESLRDELAPGRRVRVPFGPRTMAGWCVGFAEAPDVGEDGRPVETKEVLALLDDGPLVDPEMLALARWIADTYSCSWGEALSACVPGGVRSEKADATVLTARLAVPREKALAEALACEAKHVKRARVLRVLAEHEDGLALRDLVRSAQCTDSPVRTLARRGLVELGERVLDLDPFAGAAPEPPADVVLTPEQRRALDAVSHALAARRAKSFLLLGVTGSGKTEVYLRAIRECVTAGRQAIVLVPEIALTPQTVARFRGWFDRVAVLHSALTDAERRRQWRSIRRGDADVVIGPRSAVFAPLERLALVVVDEEHEPSFKQQSAPRYQARDVALERARRAGAVLLLGSATPSLESRHAADTGELELLRLPARVGASLPRVEIVDLVLEARETKRVSLLSRRLVELLRRAHAAGQQSILFLNRRGFATSLYCGRCGSGVACPRCSTSMTLHRARGTVLCHHCGHEAPPPSSCPGCSAPAMARLGAGTERLEDVVRAVVPGVRLARMDSDSMHDRGSYERVLSAFARGELDLLVGTQMIAKGLHFPNVTVVGVVSADTGLTLPDFRAAERTFQLVAQVAGRAGRAASVGRVVVQTMQPQHPALVAAARHDYDGFADAELAERRRFRWPPYVRLVRAVVTGRDETAARERCDEVTRALAASLPPDAAEVLGPAPCPIERVRNRFRFHCVVKAADPPVQHAAVLRLARFSRRVRGTELTIDVDPVDMA